MMLSAIVLSGPCSIGAGSIRTPDMAEAFYGIPEEMKEGCRRRLPEDMLEVMAHFDQFAPGR